MIILGICALGSYVWMCAIVPAIANAGKAVVQRSGTASWQAFLLAMIGGALWTVVALAAVFLSLMLAPNIGLAVMKTRLGLFGLLGGMTAWTIHALSTRHLPRIGSNFEIATALGIVALAGDEPKTIRAVEQLYRAYAAPDVRRTF